MGLFYTAEQDALELELKEFVDLSKKMYQNHAYATGYLSSTVVHMLRDLNKKQRAEVLEGFRRANKSLTEKLVDQALKTTA